MGHDGRGPAPAHLVDSRVLGGLFSSSEVKEIFDDAATVQAWLDVEVALVRGQADLGIAPREAAEAIAVAADVAALDLVALGREVETTAHPLIPVIRALAELSGPAGAWVHYGATTQDVLDSALVLQSARGLAAIQERVRALAEVLAELAARHRDLPMVGRTHAQHALPITLGYKFAVLLAETDRHLDRLAEVRPRALVGQLGGAVGSLAAFGPHGPDLVGAVMGHLGLRSPDIAWHTSRDGLTELTCVLAMVSATCGKIANEIRVLQRTEVDELAEPFELGKIGSSTMPHKRNPMFAEYVVSSAILARRAPADMLTAMLQEHERDMTVWGVEWSTVPQTFVTTAGALERVTSLLHGVEVHREAIARNLHQLGDLLLSEAVMMRLAPQIGKSEAHEVVYQAAMSAWDSERTLSQTLLADPEVAAVLDRDELDALLVPESYVGSCPALVDQVLARHHRRHDGHEHTRSPEHRADRRPDRRPDQPLDQPLDQEVTT